MTSFNPANNHYNLSYLYFGARDYSLSLKWLNKILHETNIDTREDIHCFARIFILIIHFELDNHDLLEYIVKSTYRFLYKRKRLFEVETSILNFIRQKLPKINRQEKLLNSFKELKIELEQITQNPIGKKALAYFDYISWLKSKIENKSFADTIKEKAKHS